MHALGEPGRAKINFPFAKPASALDCREDVPILLKLTYLKISPNPGIFFSITSSTASGVESLPVKPVPPVKITTSISFLFIELDNSLMINSLSSVTNFFSSSWCPDSRIFSSSILPDLSDL